MLRQPIAALAVLVLVFSPLCAEEPAKVASDDVREAPPAAVEEAKDDATNRVVQAQLDRVLPEITFEGVSFSDTIDFLRDVTSANVFVNWRALEAAGIDRNAPVTAKLKQVKFGKALQLMLDDVAGGKNKLAYEIDDNVITVSTAEDLGKNTVTRVYDVRDLIRPAANAPADKTADKAADPAAPAPAAAHQEKRVKILTDLIVTSVAPATWRETRGGSSGAIRELQGQLIITQTQENQIAIMNLIGGLRDLMNIERGLPTSDPPAEFPLLRQSKP